MSIRKNIFMKNPSSNQVEGYIPNVINDELVYQVQKEIPDKIMNQDIIGENPEDEINDRLKE